MSQWGVPAADPGGRGTPVSGYFDDSAKGIDDKALLLDHIGLPLTLSWWCVKARVANLESDAQVRRKAKNKRVKPVSDVRSANT